MRLLADGAVDTDFKGGLSGPDFTVLSIAVLRNGKLVIGGFFTTVNSVPAAYAARLWGSADIPPQIKSANRNGGVVNLVWEAIPNRTYRLQFEPKLSANNWTDLAEDVSATAGTASKTDTTLGEASQRFYRVVLLP